MSNSAFNPYAAPAAPVEDVSANAEAEAIRKAHISHEASIKAVGLLYYLGGIGVTLAALAGLVGAKDASVGVTLLLIGPASASSSPAGACARCARGAGSSAASCPPSA